QNGSELVRCVYLFDCGGYNSALILPLILRLMISYNINKGIGRIVEFKGLKAQYLFIFAGGLLGTLIFVMILYMAGVNSDICLLLRVAGTSLIIWQTSSLNRKYGEHGLMKVGARKRHPRYIICRKPIHRYLKFTPKSNAL